MRILSLTAGAASMYCGSCLRDNALATELIARGHDVTLLPVYTPTLTDEPNVSGRRVFFGGVSVYLQQHFAVLPALAALAGQAVGFVALHPPRVAARDPGRTARSSAA